MLSSSKNSVKTRSGRSVGGRTTARRPMRQHGRRSRRSSQVNPRRTPPRSGSFSGLSRCRSVSRPSGASSWMQKDSSGSSPTILSDIPCRWAEPERLAPAVDGLCSRPTESGSIRYGCPRGCDRPRSPPKQWWGSTAMRLAWRASTFVHLSGDDRLRSLRGCGGRR